MSLVHEVAPTRAMDAEQFVEATEQTAEEPVPLMEPAGALAAGVHLQSATERSVEPAGFGAHLGESFD